MAAVSLPAALAHPTGQPRVGDVYWVDTAACYGGDKKPRRPVVVVRAANPPLLTDVIVVARTSDVVAAGTGVLHTGISGSPLNKDGKFMKKWRHNVDARFFSMPAIASYAGELDPLVLHDVLKMMGMS